MQRFTLWSATCILAASFFSSAAFAQKDIIADISDSVTGTWVLKYEGGTSPFANGTTVTLILDGANDTLCVNGKVLNTPYAFTTGSLKALTFWPDNSTSDQLVYSWSGGTDSAEFVVWDKFLKTSKGYFFGTRTSTSTAGCKGALGLDDISQEVVDTAIELYPDLFGSDGTEVRKLLGYRYRFFPRSGIYTGFKDSKVYVMGGIFGPAIVDQGFAAILLTNLQNVKAARVKK